MSGRRLVGATLAMSLAGTAHADVPRIPTIVVPLRAPAELSQEATHMADALACTSGGTVTALTMPELSSIAGCTATTDTCLDRIASALFAERILIGAVTQAGDRLTVEIVEHVRGGRPHTMHFDFPRSVWLEHQPCGTFRWGAPTRDEPISDPRRDGMTTPEVVLVGIGFAGIVAGSFLAGNAMRLSSEATIAPRNTPDDRAALDALEERQRRRMISGVSLLVVGGLLSTYVLLRAGSRSPAIDHHVYARRSSRPRVIPMAAHDSIGLGVRWER